MLDRDIENDDTIVLKQRSMTALRITVHHLVDLMDLIVNLRPFFAPNPCFEHRQSLIHTQFFMCKFILQASIVLYQGAWSSAL